MRPHIDHFKYVLRHKWFVFWACLELGVPLWIAVLHDWTKFLPCEWFAYTRVFYGLDGPRHHEIKDSSGAYDRLKLSPEFQMAWLHHQRNKHHWQAWVAIGDYGLVAAVPMPEAYVREMVADWIGAGRVRGGGSSPREYYEANEHKMRLHETSRAILEEVLGSQR